jgi:hypothetical protein
MIKHRTTAALNEEYEPHVATKCVLCREKRAFELPDHLLDELQNGRVVVFAGAGVSTETQTVFPFTLYQEVHSSLGLPEEIQLSFPSLMSKLCERPNGRRDLLQRIHKRLSYITAFQELYRTATRFHRELASLFYVQDIVTTNWDDYFERECGAIPLVVPEDFAFWDLPGRKVFKIHGSINNPGSIVATDKDYTEVHARLERGALGSALKLLLATKTIVYIGYSFTDQDFTTIKNYIMNELKDVAPKAYIVTLDLTSEERFKREGLHPIFTDATFFVSFIKKHLEGNGHYLADNRFDAIPEALDRVHREHEKLFASYRPIAKPEIVYCAAYQDGLAHAFERICDMRKTGEYSHRCEVIEKVQKYERICSDKLKARRYVDVAYIDGYINALIYLLLDGADRRMMPFFYVYGLADQPTSFTRFKHDIKQSSSAHKAACAHAKKIVARQLGPNDVIHHTPFLS